MNKEMNNYDPSNRRQNWDEEEYFEYLVDQYEQDLNEEEDITGDL
jgi:hypothetical protein